MKISNSRKKLAEGVYLNLVNTTKFKSNLINIYILRQLNKNEVTKNALLPLVLKRGTSKYKTSLDLERKLEDLYGSNLSIGVSKKGEKQVIRISIESVDEKYVDKDDLFTSSLEIINEILYHPQVENKAFIKNYVEQEKKNLKDKIESRINNKKQYAVDRCIEEMCPDEPFSIYKLGYTKDLNEINEKNLYEHYQNVLNTSYIEISIVGNVDKEVITSKINDVFKFDRKNVIQLQREKNEKNIQKVNVVHDSVDLNQGKLTLGYRTNIPYESNLYEAFLIGSSILGGGPDSKLFINVREKQSLAYYIYTKSYKYKSIMLIASGIEFDKYEKTLEIIKEQVESIKNGEFTENDINQSKKSIITSIRNITDDNFSISEFYLSNSITNDNKNLDDIICNIEKSTKKDILDAMKSIELDTVYFLKNK